MDIGTAKEPKPPGRAYPHHLLDIWPVTRAANVTDYASYTRAAIEDAAAEASCRSSRVARSASVPLEQSRPRNG